MKLPYYYLQRMRLRSFADLCDKGRLIDVRTALDNGANVNEVNNVDSTGLMMAILFGHDHVAEVLLQHPAIDVNIVDNIGYSALHMAVSADNHKMTAMLLARRDLTRATINHRNHEGQSPIMIAIDCNSVNCIPLLLACTKVDLNMRARPHRSPQEICK